MKGIETHGGKNMLKVKVATKLLDELSMLYSDKFKAIGEIIINSIDSGASKIWVITQTMGEITVIDNGAGMTEDDIINKYLLFGFSHKQLERQEAPAGERVVVGRKGIAKVSGLSIANKITISTWNGGEKHIFYIDRDEYTKHESLSDYTIPHKIMRVDGNELSAHGTEVKLSKLKLVQEIDEKALMNYIAVNLPVYYPDMEIRVNGIKVERTRIPYDTYMSIDEKHPILGRITGELFRAKESLSPNHGVITRVRGVAIGKPSMFKAKLSNALYAHLYAWYLGGEIDKVEAFERQDEGLVTAGREGFVETNVLYMAYETWISEKITAFLDETQKKHEEEFKKKSKKMVERRVTQIEKGLSTICKERGFKNSCILELAPKGKGAISTSQGSKIIINTDHLKYRYAVANKCVPYHILSSAIDEIALRESKSTSDFIVLKDKLWNIFTTNAMQEERQRKKKEKKTIKQS